MASRENGLMASRAFWPHKKIYMNMNSNMNSMNSPVLTSQKNADLTSQKNQNINTEYEYLNSTILNSYLSLQKKLIDIQRAIVAAESPVKSPTFGGVGGSANRVSDPTVSAFYRLEKLRKQETEAKNEIDLLREQIEKGLLSIDPALAAAIEYHFIKGYTWRETSFRMYKKQNSDAARKLYRDWKKQKK